MQEERNMLRRSGRSRPFPYVQLFCWTPYWRIQAEIKPNFVDTSVPAMLAFTRPRLKPTEFRENIVEITAPTARSLAGRLLGEEMEPISGGTGSSRA